jgi:hypothetical protein
MNDGGPAFPRPTSRDEHSNDRPYQVPEQDGMSLRDYFAAAALAHPYTQSRDAVDRSNEAAKLAYYLADAMLAERSKS